MFLPSCHIVSTRLHPATQKKEDDMRGKMTWWVLFSAAMLVAALCYVGHVSATPASGFTSKTLYKGTFGDVDVVNKSILPNGGLWFSLQKTEGSSDLYVQQNIWQGRGTTGWHTHPGHSLIIVTEGTVTAYDGDDPTCTPHVYKQGMTFVDPGGKHVHIVRNESDVEAQTIAVQLIPAGAKRRIDAADPGNCPF
jgi:quercetin dioxygenase-like cupin family protein